MGPCHRLSMPVRRQYYLVWEFGDVRASSVASQCARKRIFCVCRIDWILVHGARSGHQLPLLGNPCHLHFGTASPKGLWAFSCLGTFNN